MSNSVNWVRSIDLDSAGIKILADLNTLMTQGGDSLILAEKAANHQWLKGALAAFDQQFPRVNILEPLDSKPTEDYFKALVDSRSARMNLIRECQMRHISSSSDAGAFPSLSENMLSRLDYDDFSKIKFQLINYMQSPVVDLVVHVRELLIKQGVPDVGADDLVPALELMFRNNFSESKLKEFKKFFEGVVNSPELSTGVEGLFATYVYSALLSACNNVRFDALRDEIIKTLKIDDFARIDLSDIIDLLDPLSLSDFDSLMRKTDEIIHLLNLKELTNEEKNNIVSVAKLIREKYTAKLASVVIDRVKKGQSLSDLQDIF